MFVLKRACRKKTLAAQAAMYPVTSGWDEKIDGEVLEDGRRCGSLVGGRSFWGGSDRRTLSDCLEASHGSVIVWSVLRLPSNAGSRADIE